MTTYPTTLIHQLVAGAAPAFKQWNVDEFHLMIEKGIIAEGAPFELIDGAVVYKQRGDAGDAPMTHGRRHAAAVRRLAKLERRLDDTGCCIQTQLPVVMHDQQEPEPDACLLRGASEEYDVRKPIASDALVVIEVADTSLDYDRTVKQRVYAAAGIPIFWIVNLRNNTVEVYEQPDASSGEYRVRRDHQAGESMQVALPSGNSLAVGVNDIVS
jgi:Uma2 family endonuclease